MRRTLVQVIVLVSVYGALILWLPEMTVSPGDLIDGHEEIAEDCFACHTPFRGALQTKCMECHELEAIGVRTTAGRPVAERERPAFHQALLDPACIRCHSDHLGPGRAGARVVFTHDVIREDVLTACGDCHGSAAPDDDIHQGTSEACGTCHGFEAWKPATFEHAMLATDRRNACVTCHAAARPADVLHRNAGDDCASCHETGAWTPATFDHEEHFRFDRDHPEGKCRSCHPDTLDRYTCYGCHEHSPRGIAREHREEGIRDFEDCVKCHRSGDEDEAERIYRRLRRSRTRR